MSSIPLTPGERTLLKLLSSGHTNAQIGLQLGRSEKTIRNRLTHLYAKLGASNRVSAVMAWLRTHPQ